MISTQIDHLILGINNLQKGVQYFEDRTGVKPQFGGEHPAFGTHNELVSLDKGAYLEIIAPKPDLPAIESPFGGLEPLEDLTIIGWAIRVTDLPTLEQQFNQAGVVHSGIHQGHRKTRTGQLIQWETIFPNIRGKTSIDPFFISWNDMTIHPSGSTPPGCQIESLKTGLTGLEPIDQIVQSLSFSVAVKEIGKSLRQFTLNTPKGLVDFS